MPNFKKVQSGNALEIPASTWNAMIDTASAHAAGRHNQRSEIENTFRQADIILVKNSSGDDLGRFSILGIDKPIFEPNINELEFKNQVALIGKKPTADHRGRFVILLDPLANTKIGLAWIGGVCVAKVKMESATHQWADVETDQTGALISSNEGQAQILWVETGTGEKWAVIRIGTPPISRVALVQAPAGGIPKRTGSKPGSATCQVLVVATTAATGIAVGDLVRNGNSVSIKNWTFDVAASDGDRVAQVEGHFDGAMIVGWSCTNNGSAVAIKDQA